MRGTTRHRPHALAIDCANPDPFAFGFHRSEIAEHITDRLDLGSFYND
jgi:hypothetical protein